MQSEAKRHSWGRYTLIALAVSGCNAILGNDPVPLPEAGVDARVKADAARGHDARPDVIRVGGDASRDARNASEAATDSGFDAGRDAEDAGHDAPTDVAIVDAGVDGRPDAAQDAGADSHSNCALKSCGSVNDCRQNVADCMMPTCQSHCCGTAPAPMGTACVNSPGFCNENHLCVPCVTADNCAAVTCQMFTGCLNETCAYTSAGMDTNCPLPDGVIGKCDGNGNCKQ